ncbi:MAG: lysophospholipid acyltransferase family protein [Desulfobacteraceae bacterium]|jgi:KDO2-lipid IV(A) lauroyltransferase|nr:lysophospholipid acyltransferase family protein [Desulfobacteraceae bacterium]
MTRVPQLADHLIHGFFRIIGLIPMQPAAALGDALGGLWYRLDRRHRKIARANLKIAFGREKTSREIDLLARRSFQNLGRLLFEVGWLQGLAPGEVARHFSLEGFTPGRLAQLRRGVLVLTAHFGNWEILPAAATMLGVRLSIVYRPLDFAPLDRFFGRSRSRFGADLIPKKNALFRIVRALRGNRAVGILMDQNVKRDQGVFVDFFGRPVSTNKGLAQLALKTRAPVYPMFLVRRGRGFTVVIEDQVPLAVTGDPQRDVALNSRRYNQTLEKMIRRYPDQWFWVHRRWKKHPKAGQPVWDDI